MIWLKKQILCIVAAVAILTGVGSVFLASVELSEGKILMTVCWLMLGVAICTIGYLLYKEAQYLDKHKKTPP